MAKNDGGLAFPRMNTGNGGVADQTLSEGMALRDWYAGMALVGILAARYNPDVIMSTYDVATDAGNLADAMLRERRS